MDDLDLEILKRCLPGDQSFNLHGKSAEEAEAFNEWGDRLLALRDRGLLDFPDGLIQWNHQGGLARYYRIGVRRVAAAGRHELGRHEPPDAATIETIRAKIGQDIADRRRLFGAKYGELTSRYTAHGTFHSSMMMQAVEGLVDDEYRERGKLLINRWCAVLAAQDRLLTPRVAQMMNDDLFGVLEAQSTDIREVFLGSPTAGTGRRTEDELSGIREAARRGIEADINYSALTPTLPAPPAPAANGGTTHHTVFNLSGANTRVNIGSDDSSQNIVNITPEGLFRELRAALEAQVQDAEARGRLLARLEELEQAQGKPSLGERYVRFMAAAADHATVLGPYLPALAQLLTRG
jgi:hypothetical protein